MNLKIKFELEETELNGEIENLIPSSSGGSLPSGGTTGQVLTKNSDADGDAGWKEPYTYVLPAATAQTLGGVKIGDGINITEDGTISAEGGGGGSSLIGKYVHSGNPVIQPTALDLETGVFTCEGHGLVTGNDVLVVPDGSFAKIPYELCSTSMNSINAVTVRVIDDNTFCLRGENNADIVYTNTVNTSIDVSKFHIEKSSKQKYTINGFSADAIKVRMSGFAWGTKSYYLAIHPKDSNGYVNTIYGNNHGFTSQNFSCIAQYYEVEVNYGKGENLNSKAINAPTTSADYTYLISYPTLMGFNSRSKGYTTSYLYALAEHGDFTSVVLSTSMNPNSLDNCLMLANGFTVEVYKLG